MRIIKEEISKSELEEMAKNMFGDFVKAVVDVEKGIMTVDAELHADLEALLLEHDSKQENLWGINLYPELSDADFVEFDSMINIRPRQNNRSRDVEIPEIRKKIVAVVNKLVI
jgi:hypothetical protein